MTLQVQVDVSKRVGDMGAEMEQYFAMTLVLIEAAGSAAAFGPSEDDMQKLRKLQTLSGALLSALAWVQMRQPIVGG